MNKELIYVCMLAMIVALVSAIDVTDCQELNVEGATYELVNDIVNSVNDFQGSCLDLSSAYTTLDCHGYLINITFNDFGQVIRIMNHSSIIKNCTIYFTDPSDNEAVGIGDFSSKTPDTTNTTISDTTIYCTSCASFTAGIGLQSNVIPKNNMNFTNINISGVYSGISLVGNDSVFTNIKINSLSTGFSLYNSYRINVYNSIFVVPPSELPIQLSFAGTLTCINCTYNTIKEQVEANITLTRQWYYDASARDVLFNRPLRNANISLTNSTSEGKESKFTDANGNARFIVTQYVNNGGTRDYGNNNYTATATKSGFNMVPTPDLFNMTTNLQHTFYFGNAQKILRWCPMKPYVTVTSNRMTMIDDYDEP